MRKLLAVALFVIVGVALAFTIVPPFLDRIYYRGAPSGHFDGARFFNADGSDDDTRPPGGGSRFGFFWRQLTRSDGRPGWPDAVPVLPAGRAELADPTPGEMRAIWIGHASVLVQTHGLNLLTDPIWSDSAGPFGFGPKRVAAPGIALDDLPRINVVLVSHNHYDHLDLATLKRLWERDRPLIVTALGNDAILRSAGIEATALDWGGAVAVPGHPEVRVHVTRNHHWGSRWFTDRNRALWSSFVIEQPGGNLFFAGDTGFGDGRWADEAARFGPIRLALIPIGAFRFQAGQMGSAAHIGPVDAVEVFRRLGAQTAIPIHWGTFRLSYEGYLTPPKLLSAALGCAKIDPRRFAMAQIGRPVEIAPLGSPPVAPVTPRAEIVRCLDTPAVRALR